VLEKRNLYRDLAALALVGVVIFLALALATYDPADPVRTPIAPLDRIFQPDPLVHPSRADVQNICGTWGALAASALFTWLGLGAYYFVLSLAILDYQLLRRREIDMPALRVVGWVASLWGVCTIAALAFSWLTPGPVIGAGGYLGALGHSLVLMHFAWTGGLILASSVTLGGLLLATDYALIQAVVFVFSLLAWRRAGDKSADGRASGKRSRSDLDDMPFGETSGVPIKIRGKPAEPAAAKVEKASDEVGDEDGDLASGFPNSADASRQPATATTVRQTGESPIKIRPSQEGSGRSRAGRADAEDERGQPHRRRRRIRVADARSAAAERRRKL
jgi:S-DNA-T family DNA segregation ATPase FtsK/SpoIIIE